MKLAAFDTADVVQIADQDRHTLDVVLDRLQEFALLVGHRADSRQQIGIAADARHRHLELVRHHTDEF